MWQLAWHIYSIGKHWAGLVSWHHRAQPSCELGFFTAVQWSMSNDYGPPYRSHVTQAPYNDFTISHGYHRTWVGHVHADVSFTWYMRNMTIKPLDVDMKLMLCVPQGNFWYQPPYLQSFYLIISSVLALLLTCCVSQVKMHSSCVFQNGTIPWYFCKYYLIHKIKDTWNKSTNIITCNTSHLSIMNNTQLHTGRHQAYNE